MRQVTDQMGRCVWVPKQPKRIISLVPSQTELLFDLGVKNELVGLTKFCVHPKGLMKEKTIVGGTKTYKYEIIESLQPDLIIGNKEENEQEGIERLAEDYPVWMSDIATLDQACDMMIRVGELTDKSIRAQKIVGEIKTSFDQLDLATPQSAVYLIWNDPMMVAGQGTFIDEMMMKCGFHNLIAEERYPSITMDQLVQLAPERLLLSSEPFPFKEKHIEKFRVHLPESRIDLVDGEMFSWYGSRLLNSPAYFRNLL